MADPSVISVADDVLRSVGQRLVRQHPEFESVFVRARDLYARSYVRANALANRVRYDAPIEPYRLLRVDPDDIEYTCAREQPMFREAGAVVDGDWDELDRRFEETDVFRAYERHFEEGVPWQETDFYGRILDELAAGQERWNCRTVAEFEARCEQLDGLYERIESEGYRSQAELLGATTENFIRDPDRLKTERFKDEIAVHVGRDGDLLFADGRNRLCMTKLIGVDEVLVRVLRRHTGWQAVRDAYVRGTLPLDEYPSHPDLVYLRYGGL